jgi:hypothetical protein
MAYLSSACAWREAAATLWVMLLGAGLLATSDIDHGPGRGESLSWSGPGPVATLSDAEPVRAFAVTLLVPKVEAAAWLDPTIAHLGLRVSAQHVDSNPAETSGAEAGAPGAPESAPWLTSRLRDPSGMSLVESAPVLTEWSESLDLEFSGACEAPDPAGADPCRLSFIVEFERRPSGISAASEISWSMDLWASVPSAAADLELLAGIEPL